MWLSQSPFTHQAARCTAVCVGITYTGPPVILWFGHRPRWEAKYFSVGKRIISVPCSETTVNAVTASMPLIWVRSPLLWRGPPNADQSWAGCAMTFWAVHVHGKPGAASLNFFCQYIRQIVKFRKVVKEFLARYGTDRIDADLSRRLSPCFVESSDPQ